MKEPASVLTADEFIDWLNNGIHTVTEMVDWAKTWRYNIEAAQREKCTDAYWDASVEYQHSAVPAIAQAIEAAGQEE